MYRYRSRNNLVIFNRFCIFFFVIFHLLFWDFDQEQPLLLEDLLEQEKREQERQAASNMGNDMDQINIYNVVNNNIIYTFFAVPRQNRKSLESKLMK